ncbi:DUF6612 family protein [Halalkalibacter urbisdiaboli]|uniref:DUF6612 family protein n=1 Tax=Halalkalibacter urbisdiaboli TaxID=1960589 RepID=UPI000B43D70A|nr:DUF6612 family protein [Halalkalibacter urbisdiaboli]
MTKKWLLAGVSTLYLLSACNDLEPTVIIEPELNEEEPQIEETQEEPPAEEEEPEVDEILTNMLKAAEQIESFSTSIYIEQVTYSDEDEPVTQTVKKTIDAIKEPFSFYQQTSMTIPEIGDLKAEIYYTDQGVFLKDNIENMWVKYPDELKEDLLALQANQIRPEEQAKLLQARSKNIILLENDEHYIVILPDVDEEFANTIQQAIVRQSTTPMSEMLTILDLTDVKYHLYINKETFLYEKLDVTLQFEGGLESTENLMLTQKATIEFNQFNDFDEIIAPEEVIETAENFNINLDDFEGLADFEMGELGEIGIIEPVE